MSPNAHDERTKPTAGLINTVAGACIVVGGVTPLAAFAFGVQAVPARPPGLVALFGLAFVLAGLILHWGARALLRKLL